MSQCDKTNFTKQISWFVTNKYEIKKLLKVEIFPKFYSDQAWGEGGGEHSNVEMVHQTVPWRCDQQTVQNVLPGHQHWPASLWHGLQNSGHWQFRDDWISRTYISSRSCWSYKVNTKHYWRLPVVHLILNLSSSTFLSTSYYSSSYKGIFFVFC